MLPSTPLHHLLLREVGLPLVMTSGNLTDEPICIDDDEAQRRLEGVADAFLLHDREIVSRYHDSVTRCWRSGCLVIRRARSFAPAPLELPVAVKPMLGVVMDVSNINHASILAKTLEKNNIILNKNLLPWDDVNRTDDPSGIRVGTQEITRRGMKESEMAEVAEYISGNGW